MKFFNNKSCIRDIQAGTSYTIVLLENGLLYAMGKSEYCGQGLSAYDFYSPVLVSIGNANKIVSIYCSFHCTIIQTVNQQFYMFGDLEYLNKSQILTPQLVNDIFPINQSFTGFEQEIQIKKFISSKMTFFLLTKTNDLYIIKNDNQWTFCKTNVLDVQTGIHDSFLFLVNPFLVYHADMKNTDLIILFE